jgi:hypothetical protein
LATSPAYTVDRAATGSQPAVEKPGWETAASLLTCADVWIFQPAITVAPPASAF